MAAANKYQSSKETTNFARICRVVIDVIPDLLRDLLITRLPVSGLSAVLTSQKDQIFSLLNNQQKKILYPPGGVFQGSVKDLDTSLLYILLRNIVNIPAHKNGWARVPDVADRSLSANIDRLRIQRNEAYAHAPIAALSDTDFNDRWAIIRQSVEDIQNNELRSGSGSFVVAVDNLLTMRIDPSTEQNFITLISEIKGEIGDITVTQDKITTDVENLKSNISTVRGEVGAVRDEVRDEVGAVRGEVDAVRGEVGAVRDEVRGEVGAVRREVGAVRGEVDAVREEVGAVKRLNSSANRGRDPKLAALIDTTTARISKEKECKYIPTKSFREAHTKLMKNKVVVIKGNSGDGKTSIALELLRVLFHDVEEGQQRRQPVELHDIKDLDLVAPMSHSVIYFDDVFGKNVVCKQDVNEWEKRVESVLENIYGNESTDSNFLIITIRRGIFNSLPSSCLKHLFTAQNIVDVNIDEEEKLEFLRLYQPKDKFVPWKESEEKEIVKCAPDIGFPQCCRLFRDTPTLQTERINFFKKPFHFLKSSLSKLEDGKCYGLMYLFLNGGKVMEDTLDSNSKNIDENVLEAAFANDVVEVTQKTEILINSKSKVKKIEFVKKSLDRLLDWMVKKEQKQKVCYKFSHDSIEETLALLYGEKTPIGFIQNCPSKFLSYLTTSKTTQNRVTMSSDDQYNVMYERLFKEFESVYNTDTESERFYSRYGRYSKYHSITSLDVWTDVQLLQGFIRWLSGQDVDKHLCHEIKLVLLNGACYSGSEECALYLLSEGVEPDEETLFCVVKGGSMSLLRKLLKYKVTLTARAYESLSSYYNINVLQEACLCEREEMVTVLYNTDPHLVHHTDKYGRSTLHLVARTGNCDIFKTVERFILKSLCRVEDEQHKCERVEGGVVHRNCVCAQYMSGLVDMWGKTVLHYSCEEGHRELSRYLCETYPTLTTAVDNDGQTALHHSCSGGHRELSRYLCETYPSLTTAVDKYGRTVLHLSCGRGHRELIRYLCETYPSLTTAVDNAGQTALHYSCSGGHRELSRYLCETYPSLTTAVDKYGRTALHYSCEYGHRELSRYLCETYPTLTTAVDNDGLTVLHWSCMMGHREVSSYLCETYPTLTTAVDNAGLTALHYSCRRGRRELSRYLCETYPTLTTAVDGRGRHCLHHIAGCRWSRRSDLLDMFTECETHVKQYLESTGRKYDITTILTNQGESVLDIAKEGKERWREENDPLYDHLVQLFDQDKH